MKIFQQSPFKLSIILLSAVVCISLFSARAYAAPQSSVSQCSGTKTTERKDGKDQAGNTLSCEWDKCTTLSCSSGGGKLDSCVSKTEYSNPRNCTEVRATGPSRVRGRNRVRGAERQMSAPVTKPSNQNRNPVSDQITIIESGVESGFDEADSIFGKRSNVRESGRKPGKKPLTKKLQAPSNLVISKIGSNKLTLSWQDNSTREFGVAIYRMQPGPASRRYVRMPNWKYIASFREVWDTNTKGKGRRSDEDYGLTPGTKYCYRIQAYFGFNKSETSGFSNTTCARTKISPRNAATTQTRNAVAAQTRNVAAIQVCGIKFGDDGKDSPWIKLKNNRITRTNDIGGPWSFIRETYGPCSFTVYNEKAFKGRKVRYGTDIKYRVRTGLVGGSRGGWRTRSVIIRPARQKKCKIILSVESNDSRFGGNVIGAQTFYGPDQHINIGASDYIHKTSGNCTFTLYNQDDFNGRIAVFNRVSSQARIGWRARSLEIKPR